MLSKLDFVKAINYYDRDEAADKTSLSEKASDMFGYYENRMGSSGCFDSWGDKNFQTVMEQYKKYQPTHVWTSWLSFTKEDAEALNLKTKKDYSMLTEKVVSLICKEMHLDLMQVEWGGYLHTNKQHHPHVHFYLYDKLAPIKSSLLSKQQINNIRSGIAKLLTERNADYIKKDELKSKVLEKVKHDFNSQAIVKSILNGDRSNSHTSYTGNIPLSIIKMFLHLENELPVNGRLSYNAKVLKPFKQSIDKIIDEILASPQVSCEYNILNKQLLKMDNDDITIYGKGNHNYRDNQLDRIRSIIGNSILKAIKIYRLEKQKDEPTITYREKKAIARLQLRRGYSHAMTSCRRFRIINTYYTDKAIRDLVRTAEKENMAHSKERMDEE